MTDSEVVVSKEDFSIWKALLVTKVVYQRISEVREFYKETLSSVDFQLRSSDIERGRYIGFQEALDMMLNLEIEESEELSIDA